MWPCSCFKVRQSDAELLVCLSEEAESKHILQAMLEAAHLRTILQKLATSPQNYSLEEVTSVSARKPKIIEQLAVPVQTTLNDRVGVRSSHSKKDPEDERPLSFTSQPYLSEKDFEICANRAHRLAKRDLPRFLEDLSQKGWKIKNVLLSTSEKVSEPTLRS
ncbi:hypothetical protein CEUSTIGMA_g8278.t1 [Chlamydomonas eustigma]|uniref:Root UVB sensitive protein C-terminal domain-containing protein n=1 Tax=Chlamydomonas eustigma TaxID=1157962 RepID=A0A250XCM6_9CHLO|nr:hypothetical protein CEUSTIGMA_g8278.t1 [Chlamydomonas eustigma]|eukprot:GAX80843.1 hypothetical protein CEUSTIGMA_g8278.t1 [Chlamydomonas eustigma]